LQRYGLNISHAKARIWRDGRSMVGLTFEFNHDPIEVAELKESVVIFDDIDVISDRRIKEAVYDILNKVLEIGRHFKITCVVTNHLPTNGRDTRRILNEAHTIVYFPHSAGGKIRYLLTEYLGLDRKTISHIKRQNSRWCCIFKNYPQIYMLEHDIGLLNTLDDDEEEETGSKRARRDSSSR
jgi:hypothetical protein